LAIGVVAFHVGGGWVIGRAAVFAFYFVSGFLISRVLDTSYRGGVDRLAAFYCKRARTPPPAALSRYRRYDARRLFAARIDRLLGGRQDHHAARQRLSSADLGPTGPSSSRGPLSCRKRPYR
jgi:hypothetical protein